MIKICELHDGAVTIHAIHVMLKVAQLHNLGGYVRVYAREPRRTLASRRCDYANEVPRMGD
jgi:hypothetical protein